MSSVVDISSREEKGEDEPEDATPPDALESDDVVTDVVVVDCDDGVDVVGGWLNGDVEAAGAVVFKAQDWSSIRVYWGRHSHR